MGGVNFKILADFIVKDERFLLSFYSNGGIQPGNLSCHWLRGEIAILPVPKEKACRIFH
jgi:hypothetical protein